MRQELASPIHFSGAVLLFLWLLAMIIGTLFKRFMMGAKGWEQVPLLDWYKAFGNLEAVGCSVWQLGVVTTLHCRMAVILSAELVPASWWNMYVVPIDIISLLLTAAIAEGAVFWS